MTDVPPLPSRSWWPCSACSSARSSTSSSTACRARSPWCGPRSRCPGCQTQLTWYENVPVVSWVVLRGRCRTCSEPGQRALPGRRAGHRGRLRRWSAGGSALSWELPAYLYLAAIGVALAGIDLDIRRLPDRSCCRRTGRLPACWAWPRCWSTTSRSMLRAVARRRSPCRPSTSALAVLKPGAMGLGDVKLAGVLGMLPGLAGVGRAGRRRLRRVPHRRDQRPGADRRRPRRPQEHHPVRPVHARRRSRRRPLGQPRSPTRTCASSGH